MRIAALVLMLLAGPACAGLFDQATDAATLARQLGPATAELKSAQTLRGRYVQLKTLRELPRPLLSEGSFLFVRDRGIVWRTETPFASELVITADALIQRQGETSQRIAADQQPAVRLVGRIFVAIFSLDFVALDQLFKLHGGPQASGWAMGLRPRQAGGPAEIEVHGAAQVQKVILREAGGDVTEIELRDMVASPAAPSAADVAAFGH